MDPIYVPLLSALAGALHRFAFFDREIYYSKRRLASGAKEFTKPRMLAMEELKIQLAHATRARQYFRFLYSASTSWPCLGQIEEADLTPERLCKIAAVDNALIAATVDLEREFQSKKGGTPRMTPMRRTKNVSARLARRFPPPWTVEDNDACFIVKDRIYRGGPERLCAGPPVLRGGAGTPLGDQPDDPRRSAAHRREYC